MHLKLLSVKCQSFHSVFNMLKLQPRLPGANELKKKATDDWQAVISVWVLCIRYLYCLEFLSVVLRINSSLYGSDHRSHGYESPCWDGIYTVNKKGYHVCPYIAQGGYCSMESAGYCSVNSLKLRQNGCHFADVIFRCLFLNEKLTKIKYNFIDVVHHWSGTNHYLSEWWPRLRMHICIT